MPTAFSPVDAMPAVDSAVRETVKLLKQLGPKVKEVSVPEHKVVGSIWTVMAIEGGVDSFYHGHHVYQHKGWYYPRLMSAIGCSIKTHGGDFPPPPSSAHCSTLT